MQSNIFRPHAAGHAAIARVAAIAMTGLAAGLVPIDSMAQGSTLSNCLWVGPVAAGQYNAGYPDEGARTGMRNTSCRQAPPSSCAVSSRAPATCR